MSTAASRSPLISAEEYLAGESAADRKHEFLNGTIYAMAGGTKRHSAITVNIVSLLHSQMRGKECRPYNSDLLVRVQHGDDLRYYYPDATIHCGRGGEETRMIDDPTVIFEVLSESTFRIDTGEKRMAYLTIPTLEAYVVVDSAQRAVTVWRRKGDGWVAETLSRSEDQLTFAKAGYVLSVGEIYEETGI